MGFKNIAIALAIIAATGLASMAMSMQEMALDGIAKYGSTGSYKSLPEEEQAVSAEVVARKASIAKSEMTVAGEASETKTETMPSLKAVSVMKYPELPSRDSSTATVMGMATGVGSNMLRFINSLRKTGYRGHIILGVNADIGKSRLAYFERQGVTPKFIKYSNCTFERFYKTQKDITPDDTDELIHGLSVCSEPYLDVKGRWAKYPMGRDWLRDCPTCTGPVLITDVRDVIFQRDPFGPGTPEVTGLQVYEEHPSSTTEHWLVDWPVGGCKGIHLKKPMLCSGTTIGTRDAMIAYLNVMYEEMKRWISDPKCRFKTTADDQSIHNWLFYNGDLEDAVAVKHREGVVNTVGVEGAKIYSENQLQFLAKGVNDPYKQPFPGATERTWISSEFGLTNDDGELTNLDGTISPVVHQYDRLGPTFLVWMRRKGVFS